MDADAKAARDIRQRCAPSIGSAFRWKASILSELVRQFRRRRVPGTQTVGRVPPPVHDCPIRASGEGNTQRCPDGEDTAATSFGSRLAISIVPLCTSCVPGCFGRIGTESAECPEGTSRWMKRRSAAEHAVKAAALLIALKIIWRSFVWFLPTSRAG